jgi:hypothetical protein
MPVAASGYISSEFASDRETFRNGAASKSRPRQISIKEKNMKAKTIMIASAAAMLLISGSVVAARMTASAKRSPA